VVWAPDTAAPGAAPQLKAHCQQTHSSTELTVGVVDTTMLVWDVA